MANCAQNVCKTFPNIRAIAQFNTNTDLTMNSTNKAVNANALLEPRDARPGDSFLCSIGLVCPQPLSQAVGPAPSQLLSLIPNICHFVYTNSNSHD